MGMFPSGTAYPPNYGYPDYTQSPGSSVTYSYGQQPVHAAVVKAMEWVVGEGGANAFAMPQGWPANQPVVLWDSTEPKIYLKSWTAQGVPLPLQKMRYVMEDQPQQPLVLPPGQSGQAQDASNFVTKNDFEQLKQEIRGILQQAQPQPPIQNQNGTAPVSQNGNRGGRNG